METLSNKIFSSSLLMDIGEPLICNNNVVFIINSYNGSKLAVYNMITGKMNSINMKNILCFNAHAYNNHVIFELSRGKRGLGVLSVDSLIVSEMDYSGNNIILGGMWENYIVLRRDYDIILYDINEKKEKTIASCHHITGTPSVGHGYSAWLQLYKEKCGIVLFDLRSFNSIVIAAPGYVNKLFLIDGHLVFQSCKDNKCFIYAYNISNGRLTKYFESANWIEMYAGKDDTLIWSVRKENEGRYMFDIHVYSIYNNKMIKVLSDYENIVIPTASRGVLMWIDGNTKCDNIFLAEINL